jgi:ABC-type transporter Mla subunit MlaD
MKKLLIFALVLGVGLGLFFGQGLKAHALQNLQQYEDKKDDGDLTKDQVTKYIGKFLEVIGELKVQAQSLKDLKLQEKVNKILSGVEKQVLAIKQNLAEIDAGDTEKLQNANDSLDKIEALVKKAEALMEDEEIETELDKEDFDKVFAQVSQKIDNLGKKINQVQEKINSKEGRGKNVIALQALLEEAKNAFGEAGVFLQAALDAYKSGYMDKASPGIYSAFSAVKLGHSLLDKIDFGKMKDKEMDKKEGRLTPYDELIWKVKKFMEIIGELRAQANNLDNEKRINTILNKIEKRVQTIYEEILAIGPDGDEDDLGILDDDLEAVKRALKKAMKLVKEGKEDIDDDVLRTEDAKKSAEDIVERANHRYKKFLKKYNNFKDRLSSEKKTTIEDLLDKAKTNLDASDVYFTQEDYENAQGYGYSSLLASKTGIKLLNMSK